MEIFIIPKTLYTNIMSMELENFCHKTFYDKNKQIEHTFAYYSLNKILKEKFNVKNTKIEYINKKPVLVSKEKYFSLSHSKEYIAIAISDYNCGIDIEKIKERNYRAIAKRMKFNCDTPEDFYKEWTKFEAEYKLNEAPKSVFEYKHGNYIITAVSSNQKESFKLSVQQ